MIRHSLTKPPRTLLVPDSVASLVRSLHPHLKKKLRLALQAVLADPFLGKELKEELAGLRSLRVSRYRIVYRVSAGRQIEIVAVGPRDRIYEETYRLLKKAK